MANDEGNEDVGKVDVNMNAVISRSQALTVDLAGKAFTSQMARQTLMADQKFDEVDTQQAHAERYLLTGSPNEATAKAGK